MGLPTDGHAVWIEREIIGLFKKHLALVRCFATMSLRHMRFPRFFVDFRMQSSLYTSLERVSYESVVSKHVRSHYASFEKN